MNNYDKNNYDKGVTELEFWDGHGEQVEDEDHRPIIPAHKDFNITQIGGDHYTQMEIQPWDVVDKWPIEQQIGMHRGNALTYIMRIGFKEDPLTQVNKAIHTLEKLRGVLQHENDKDK